MRSTFFGLNIGMKALMAQQRALDVVSHNIANAATEGYTRQDINLAASRPVKVEAGYIGTGVDIKGFQRIRDQFIDTQLRTECKELGEWEAKADILAKIEMIINEPSDSSLRSVMDQYWQAWQVLSENSPESSAARGVVVQRGVDLVVTFNHIDRLLSELQADINQGVSIRVKEINSIAQQIGDLNNQIVKAEVSGYKANDLRDKRDLLVEQLSRIVSVDVLEDASGSVTISAGGATLVSSSYIAEMRFTDDGRDPTLAKLEWVNSYTGSVISPVTINGGTLRGYLEMRDRQIVELRNELSTLAARIAEEVNDLHRTGSGLHNTTGLEAGLDFFVRPDDTQPFSASNIRVNQELIDDPNKVAASKASPVIKGDGSNALAIAQLKDKLTMNPTALGDYTATFDDYYRSMVAQVGINAQEADRMAGNQKLLVDQLLNRRESISGVSLDEEMTNMIKYQHAYTAAARVINTMDEMLELIVNRLGMVGR